MSVLEQIRAISSDSQSGREGDLQTCAFQGMGRHHLTILTLGFLLSLTTPDWIVVLCGRWSWMGPPPVVLSDAGG